MNNILFEIVDHASSFHNDLNKNIFYNVGSNLISFKDGIRINIITVVENNICTNIQNNIYHSMRQI